MLIGFLLGVIGFLLVVIFLISLILSELYYIIGNFKMLGTERCEE
jgi:hypothetical protein